MLGLFWKVCCPSRGCKSLRFGVIAIEVRQTSEVDENWWPSLTGLCVSFGSNDQEEPWGI